MTARRSTRAFDHGSDAAAVSDLAPGFCFDAEDDLAFALGYPYLVRLALDHEDDADPETTAETILCNDAPYPATVYPIATATRLARVLTMSDPIDESDLSPTRAALASLADSSPLSNGEAGSRVQTVLTATRAPSTATGLLILEALVGPDVVVDAALASLDRMTVSARLVFSDVLRIMARRLPRARCAEVEARFAGHLAPNALAPRRIPFAATPDAVLAARRAHEVWGDVPDPRLVFLGGEEVYRLELASWLRYSLRGSAEVEPYLLERFGSIRSPVTAELHLDLATRGSDRDAPRDWFFDHADYAAPLLRAIAAGASRLAKAAASILEELAG